ncbi:LPS-assembly lipoprotein LptE [Candidatus Phycosocius bacilliformis]|uniref:LPS-assembly lipoprotein LptE n=1 Tax=Candidatus Phycosocius bacilliformis TaxID=1445552 RepID=A0A2P2E6L4_9PROT|nr:LPS assembly lipoprotein LptE [Candidatus Phycosocius bacilliformis]GBF56688.1 LPS-assembly lipoprotein LptE [Candidatus Phycosocius bacilliformis]
MTRKAAIAAVSALTLLLVGCGFQPVYRTSGSGIGPVNIAPIEGRIGYYLRQELNRRAALEEERGADPRLLTVKLTRDFSPAAQGTDGISTRTELTVTVNYELAAAPPLPPVRGSLTTNVAYESLDQAYGDVALQADAEERLATQVADRIWLDLQRQVRAAR